MWSGAGLVDGRPEGAMSPLAPLGRARRSSQVPLAALLSVLVLLVLVQQFLFR